MNFAGAFRQAHIDSLCFTVLDRLVKPFLQDSEKAESDFERNSTGNIVAEIDFYLLPFGEFQAPSLDGGNDAQILQLARVQLVRQSLYIIANIDSLDPKGVKTGANFRSIVLQLFK